MKVELIACNESRYKFQTTFWISLKSPNEVLRNNQHVYPVSGGGRQNLVRAVSAPAIGQCLQHLQVRRRAVLRGLCEMVTVTTTRQRVVCQIKTLEKVSWRPPTLTPVCLTFLQGESAGGARQI